MNSTWLFFTEHVWKIRSGSRRSQSSWMQRSPHGSSSHQWLQPLLFPECLHQFLQFVHCARFLRVITWVLKSGGLGSLLVLENIPVRRTQTVHCLIATEIASTSKGNDRSLGALPPFQALLFVSWKHEDELAVTSLYHQDSILMQERRWCRVQDQQAQQVSRSVTFVLGDGCRSHKQSPRRASDRLPNLVLASFMCDMNVDREPLACRLVTGV